MKFIKHRELNEYLSEEEEERIGSLVAEIFFDNDTKYQDGMLAFSLMAYYVEDW